MSNGGAQEMPRQAANEVSRERQGVGKYDSKCSVSAAKRRILNGQNYMKLSSVKFIRVVVSIDKLFHLYFNYIKFNYVVFNVNSIAV